MAKRQFYDEGKQSTSVNTYSADHRQWGEDLAYHDVDGIEWTAVNGRWYPVALVEECWRGSADVRGWQLERYRELADALSKGYGYTVHAFYVKWLADPSKEVGERVREVNVQCLNTGQRVTWTRQRWIEQLRRLRRRVRERLSGLN